MHEIKLVCEGQGKTKATKLLHITDLFDYPLEMIVPANCIGLKIYEGDMIEDKLLHDLSFMIDDDGVDVVIHIITTKDNKIVGRVEY